MQRTTVHGVCVAAGFAALMAATAMVTRCDVDSGRQPTPAERPVPNRSYQDFFTRHKSPAPERMAAAVQSVRPENRPVLAAMAVVESGGNHYAVGDGGRSRGAWQVQSCYWGRVPTTAVGQALQAEKILEDLLKTRTLSVALAAYNGGNSPGKQAQRYASEVLALAEELAHE